MESRYFFRAKHFYIGGAMLRYPKLFTPLSVKGCLFSNRIMLTAAVSRLAGKDGQVTEELIRRYRRIARGGVGAMVVEAAVVQPSGSSFNLRISEDVWIPELSKLVANVRQENPSLRIGLQIMHFLKVSRSGWRQRVEDLSEKDIQAIPAMFAGAARRAGAAGFDFVELHMAHFTTLASFLSLANERSDQYGGDFPGRLALPLLVVRAAREAVGHDYPLGVRMNGDEFTKKGNTIAHSSRIAVVLAGENVDYISVSAGERYEDAPAPRDGEPPRPGGGYSGSRMSPRWWHPDGTQVGLAEDVRKALRQAGYELPVVTAGKIRTPDLAEEILASEQADIIGMARGLLADPEWPEKARSGDSDEIVQCAACGYCSDSDDRMEKVRCIQWPQESADPPYPWRHLPPCQAACPAGVNVRGYMELALQGRYDQALHLIKKKIPLPGVISRVCPAFCEKKCNRAQFDAPIAVNAVKQLIVDHAGLEKERVEPAPRTKDARVAVIGSGPAGLSAAYYLVGKGYGVTVFEALPVAGGMLRVGIPEKRLPKGIVETEIRNLQRFGVEIKLSHSFGQGGLSLQGLKDLGYQAIFLATGAPRKRKIKFFEQSSGRAEIPHLMGLKETELRFTGKGLVEADPLCLSTKVKGVFAGGDLVLGPATVIQALSHGRRAAEAIDRFLRGLPALREVYPVTTIAYSEIDLSHFKKRPRLQYSMGDLRQGEMGDLSSDELAKLWEAERCFKCGMFPRMR
jgi:dimethylglycine catabolism A